MNKLLDLLKQFFGHSPKWVKILVSVIVGCALALLVETNLTSCLLDAQIEKGSIKIVPKEYDSEEEPVSVSDLNFTSVDSLELANEINDKLQFCKNYDDLVLVLSDYGFTSDSFEDFLNRNNFIVTVNGVERL